MPHTEWPEPPPLDTLALTRAIQQLWMEAARNMEDRACRLAGVQLPFQVSYSEGAVLGDRLIEAITTYDAYRTELLRSLQAEVSRLMQMHPGPVIYIPR